MKGSQKMFLSLVYLLGLFLRLYPRLSIDAHLLTFQGDIWYRLAMAQFILDNLALPHPDLRYLAYGHVPMWYPPLSPLFLAALSFILKMDLPTISSRVIPFIEALSPISIFFLARYMYDEFAAYVSTLALALTPTFVFWTGISDPQSSMAQAREGAISKKRALAGHRSISELSRAPVLFCSGPRSLISYFLACNK
jgi:hypothetical protein